jgi:hypothetical protein
VSETIEITTKYVEYEFEIVFFREVFQEESRDWEWWENIRRFILSGHQSDYQQRY